MKRIASILTIAAGFFGGFALAASPAFADSLSDAAQAVVNTLVAGHYTEAAILGIILAVAGFRKFAPERWAFWRGDVGGGLLVLIMSFGAALAAGLKGGDAFSISMVWTAFKLAALSSGGYTLVKRLGAAAIAKLPLPLWVRRALTGALWLFKPGGAAAIAKAEKAGQAAVDAKPATGVGTTGTLK